MEEKILKTEFYSVIIANRSAIVSKEYYDGTNTFIIRFTNNEQSDFINSYKSLGFLVTEIDKKTTFKVFGTLTISEAGNIWLQIENAISPITTSQVILKQ